MTWNRQINGKKIGKSDNHEVPVQAQIREGFPAKLFAIAVVYNFKDLNVPALFPKP